MEYTAFETELCKSPAFLAWRPQVKSKPVDGVERFNLVKDKHFTPNELAEAWGVSAETIRNVFRNEPGVLRIGEPNGKKRKYILMRIPEPVAERVHRRLSAVPEVS